MGLANALNSSISYGQNKAPRNDLSDASREVVFACTRGYNRTAVSQLHRCPTCHQALPHVKAERRAKRKKDRSNNKYDARRAVRLALKAGMLTKGPCAEHDDDACEGPIGAHHYKGYAKKNWLAVKWYCRKHHRIVDRQAPE